MNFQWANVITIHKSIHRLTQNQQITQEQRQIQYTACIIILHKRFLGNPIHFSLVVCWLAHWADRWMIEQLQENLCNNFVSVASLWQDYCNTCNDSGHHRFFASHPCQSVDSASIWCQKSREPEKLTSDDGHWTRVQKTTQKDCLICNNSADKITRIR